MINYSSYEEALEKEGYIVHGFLGISMYPTFLENDLLVIVKTDNYDLYDVVLYKKDNKFIAHRIVDIKDNHYIIRGDNTITDEIVPKNEVLAKVESIIRNKEEIKLDNMKNMSDYKRSARSLRYRRLKNRIIKLLVH